MKADFVHCVSFMLLQVFFHADKGYIKPLLIIIIICLCLTFMRKMHVNFPQIFEYLPHPPRAPTSPGDYPIMQVCSTLLLSSPRVLWFSGMHVQDSCWQGF